MSSRTITAVYDTQAEAERAVEALAAQGIPRTDLRIHREAPESSVENQDKGFWASLADLFVPDDDRYTYAEALRRGSVMVTARVDDAHYEAAADLLETHGAVDLDQRESTWRNEGWSGGKSGIGAGGAAASAAAAGMSRGIGQSRPDTTDGSAAATASRMGLATGDQGESGTAFSRGVDDVAGTNLSGARPQHEASGGMGSASGRTVAEETGLAPGDQGRPGTMLSRGMDEVAGTNISGAHPENEMGGGQGVMGTGMTQDRTASHLGAEGTESIPVVEESLRIGKREVSGGRVRVRSYVVETPVEEQVNLRRETVDVERRAVDRPVTDADRVFQDRTIEATETSEEAVIGKEARVTEEVVIRKGTEQHTETVRDTVRRTEVEVERDGEPGTPRRG